MTPESKRARARLIRMEAESRSGAIVETLNGIADELEASAAAQEREQARASEAGEPLPAPPLPNPS